MVSYPKENIDKAKVRVEKVKKLYEGQGYKLTVYSICRPEIIDAVAENEEEVIALEITNWNKNGRLKMSKFTGWKEHWKKVEDDMKIKGDKREFRKRLIYNYFENIEFMLPYLEKEEVELEEYGYEDYPEDDRGQ